MMMMCGRSVVAVFGCMVGLSQLFFAFLLLIIAHFYAFYCGHWFELLVLISAGVFLNYELLITVKDVVDIR